MRVLRELIARWAWFFLAVVCLLSSADMVWTARTFHYWAPGLPPIADYSQRLAPVKEIVDKSGPIGYIGYAKDAPDRLIKIYSVQYAVAPIVVVPGDQAAWVIENSDGTANQTPQSPPNLKFVADFGHGLRLYRNLNK